MSAGQAVNVRTIANELLQATIKHWTNAPGEPLPARRCLVPGIQSAAAWDCEQLTVALGGIGWGPAVDAGIPSARTGTPTSVYGVRHAVLTLALVRCTPGMDQRGRPPSGAALQAAGEQFMLDAGLLSQALVRWASNVKLPDELNSSVQLGTVEPGAPQGNFSVVTASAVVTIAGLEG